MYFEGKVIKSRLYKEEMKLETHRRRVLHRYLSDWKWEGFLFHEADSHNVL